VTCPEGYIDHGLFAALAQRDRETLLGSVLGGLLPDEGTADIFCGAGGWGEGAKRSGIEVQAAVNHWDRAISVHAENNPRCSHHLGDAWRARPTDVLRRANVRRLGLLLASAACTSHSRAKGSAPVSKRVHMLGWCIARWMEEARPRVAWIENVPEWREWGPLIPKRHKNGKPVRDDQGRILYQVDPARKGQHFRKWWRYCERLGYVMEARVLEAPDFGAASRRTRLYIQARRDGMPLVWPERTHGAQSEGVGGVERGNRRADRRRPQRGSSEGGVVFEPRLHGLRGVHRDSAACGDSPRTGTGLQPHRSAEEIIDWSDLGSSIFERPRPLKPKTLARIAEGIRRFVINDPRPFVLRVTQTGEGGGWKVWPVDEPLATQTTRQDLAVCTPIIAPQNSGVFGQRPDQPGPAITTKGHQALITPILASAGGSAYAGKVRRVRDLLNTVKTDNRQCLVSPVLMHNTSRHTGGPLTAPVPTVTTGGQTGLVSPVMVTLRNHVAPAGVDQPLSCLCAGGTHHALVAALLCTYYGNSTTLRPASEPLGCVTTLDRHALVTVLIDGLEFVIVDILFRMLRPHELAAAMGFPTGYLWPKNQRGATRLIGNAVHVDVAAALIGASLPRGRMAAGEGRAVA
jgi:DNA (cytosine-5)-methyltransferase 1